MRRYPAWTLCPLLVLAWFLGTTPLPVVAADEPAIVTPATLHYEAEVTLLLAGQAGTSTAVGDFDFVRRAFHLTTVTKVEGLTIREELILLDERLYSFNPDRNRWEYRVLGPEELALAVSGPRVVVHPAARYRRVGTETIAGAATNHWRASGDYNLLTPGIIQGRFGGFLLEETLTTEVFVGAADGYLYRQTGQEDGTLTGLGATAEPPTPVSSRAIHDYSNFDQPVAITAPEGAVPADGADGGAPILTKDGTPLLLARMAQGGLPLAAEVLARLLMSTWMP